MTAEIAWGDCETTGLDARPEAGNKLLQIAVILTDGDFNELGEIEATFYFTPEEVEAMKAKADPYVLNMHNKTGLWEQLSNPMNPSYEAFDERLKVWLETHQPEAKRLKLGGNSMFLDREFWREFLPKSFEHLSYRDINMTSVEEFFVFTENRPRYVKKLVHEAMSDIRESIEQARYHRSLNKPF